MAGFKIPVFENGTVLTQEMLNAMKANILDSEQLPYINYANGILSGCEVSMSGNMVYVHEGIVIFQRNLYFLSKEMKITVRPSQDWQVLRFHIGNVNQNKNFMIGEMQLELSDHLQGNENEIEICRFRLQNGALLRNSYRNFQDMGTEFDTVNEVYAQWSGYQESSVSFRVLCEFAKEALKGTISDQLDIMMVHQILNLNGTTMNRQALQFYVANRTGREYRQLSNMDIYRGLQEILRMMQGASQSTNMRSRENRRILVD